MDAIDQETDPARRYEIAAGTVIGNDHYHARQNRQDAWWVERTPHALAAVVCDGCGDPASPHAEVGATLGARLLAGRLAALAGAGMPAEAALEEARGALLAQIDALAAALGDREDALRRYFLFTVVGALITEDEATFFAIGDGVLGANDRLLTLGPYPDNAPPYPAYALIPGHPCAEARRFTIHLRLPTRDLERFVLGTDGAGPLLDDRLVVPGTAEPAGGPGHWWATDRYFSNPAALPNRLRLLATDAPRLDWDARRKWTAWSRLRDDATLVVGRRRRETEARDGDES